MTSSGESGSPAPATRGRGRWLRRFVLVLVVLIGGLALVPTLVGGLGRGFVTSKISERLRGEATLRGLSLGWFSGAAIEGLEITAEGADEPSIAIDAASLDTGLLALLTSGVKGTVEVSGVMVRANRGDQGIDLADLVKPSEAAPSDEGGELPELDLEVRVRDVTLHYRDGTSEPARVEGFARIDATIKSGAPLRVTLDDGRGLEARADVTWLDGRRVRAADAMEASGEVTAEAYALDGLAPAVRPWMRSLAGRLDCKLALDWKGGALAAKGPLRLEELKAQPRHGGEETRLRRAALECDLALADDGEPRGRVTGDVTGLRMAALAAEGRPLDVDSARVVLECLAGRVLSFSELDVTGEGLRAKGAGRFALGGEAVTGESRLELDGDVAKLAAFAGDLPAMSGALKSRVALVLAADRSIKIDGETRIRDFKATGLPGGAPDIREPEVLLQHDLSWGQGRLDARRARVQSSFLNATVVGSLTPSAEGRPPAGNLQVTGDADLVRVAGLLGDRLPVNLAGRAVLQGTVAAKDTGFDVTADLRGTDLVVSGGPLEGEPLRVPQLRLRSRGRLSAEGDALDLPEVSLQSDVARGEAKIRWASPEGGTRRIAVEGRFDVAADVLLRSLRADPPPAAVGRPEIALDLSGEGETWNIARAALSDPKYRAEASGTIGLPAEGPARGDLDLRLEGDLARLAAFAGDALPIRPGGRATVSGKLRLADATRFDLSAEGRDLSLQGEALGAEVVRSKTFTLRTGGAWTGAGGVLDLTALELRSEPLDLQLKEAARLSGIGTETGAEGTMKLAGAARLAALPASLLRLPEGMAARGDARVDGEVTLAASGPRGRLELTCPGLALERAGESGLTCDLQSRLSVDPAGPFVLALTAERLVVRQAGQAPAAPTRLTVDASGSLPRDGGALSVPKLSVRAPGLTADGSLTWGGGAASVAKFGADLDLEGLSGSLLPLFASDVRGSGAGRIDLDVSAPAGEASPIDVAVGSVTARLAKIETPGATLEDVDVVMEIDKRALRVNRGKARMNGGAVGIVGTVNLRGSVPSWSTRIVASKVAIEEKLQPAIARVVPLFAGLGVQVEAVASGDVKLAGTGSVWEVMRETLTGDGALTIERGALVGGPLLSGLGQFAGIPGRVEFDTFVPRFKIKDGGVYQEGVVIKGDKIDFSLAGLTKLDGALDYILGVKVKSGGTSKWQQFARHLEKDGYLPVGLGGTVTAPALKPPDVTQLATGALEGLLNKKLGDKLPGGLGGLLGPKKDGKDKKPGKDPEPKPRAPSLFDLLRKKDKKKKDKDKDEGGGGG